MLLQLQLGCCIKSIVYGILGIPKNCASFLLLLATSVYSLFLLSTQLDRKCFNLEFECLLESIDLIG